MVGNRYVTMTYSYQVEHKDYYQKIFSLREKTILILRPKKKQVQII